MNGRMQLKRNCTLIGFWGGWIIISLACNYPARLAPPTHPAVEALRQTLNAAALTKQPENNATQSATAGALLPPGTMPQPLVESGRMVIEGEIARYIARSGDTLPALASRFGVDAASIRSDQPIPSSGLIPEGQVLFIPYTLSGVTPQPALMPDSEVIESPSTVDFAPVDFINQAGGYLASYHEQVNGQTLSGAQIIQRVARESSLNPRLLLALLEFRSGWVTQNQPPTSSETYPLGFRIPAWQGLYREMVIAATHLNAGYYGWRSGSLIEIQFGDGRRLRLSPEQNAGTTALQNLFAKLSPSEASWREGLYGAQNFSMLHQRLFGDAWSRAASFEPLFPPGVTQPVLELPFPPGERWSFTGGPHPSWKTGSPRGAIDFAPVTGEPRCAVSRAWVTASAPGITTRSERNVVALDLDGDGYEQTGWVLIYLHIADLERVAAGQWLAQDERIGHPSCEGGTTTGTHVHIARKYNGEWIAADGPLPFLLSGWQVFADERDYLGEMRRDEQVVVASPVGPRTSIIVR
jgi:murein DD-endopeptidase MepM/ murein hydrolase activator NlpD